ncbi:MAG TPA: cation:proton antiporter, partial [Candidatus Nanoarchaeia archaeon]|nr:cation:proton antiporter [Candidatus Nanoarchaeia archaeon]
MEQYIFNFALLFILLGLLAFVVKLLRQPIIISYVLAGLFFSLWVVQGSALGNQIILLADIGITFLLFLMGLEFDFKNIKFLGKKLVLLTAIQTALLFVVGFSISLFFHFTLLEAVYLALFFVFSSTLLVAKWVEDKKETATLHGRLIIGTLVVQDLLAIVSLTILSAVQKTTLLSILLIPLGGLALVAAAYLFVKYLLNRLLKFACRYPELLFVFSLGVCFLFTLLSVAVGYSPAIGAFIAGVALANSNYKTEIHSRLKPLVIFFNILFFVGMGFQLDLDLSLGLGLVILFFCLLNFMVKPLVLYVTVRRGGYDIKSSALLALHLSQFSEFGIILINVGLASGVIAPSLLTVTIMSLLASMIISSYFIKYDKFLFKHLEKFLLQLERFFRKSPEPAETSPGLLDYNVLFFGYSGLGQEVSAKLNGLGKKVLFVENDPVHIEQLKKEQVNYLYNSLANPY